MKILLATMLVLILSGCGQGYLPMPADYQRDWKPYSDDTLVNTKMGPNGYVQRYASYDNSIYKTSEYKIFKIDETGVYAIVRSQLDAEYALSDFDYKLDGTPEEQKEQQKLADKIMEPIFDYKRFEISRYSPHLDILTIFDYHCPVTEKDWNASARWQLKRMEDPECKGYNRFSWATDAIGR